MIALGGPRRPAVLRGKNGPQRADNHTALIIHKMHRMQVSAGPAGLIRPRRATVHCMQHGARPADNPPVFRRDEKNPVQRRLTGYDLRPPGLTAIR